MTWTFEGAVADAVRANRVEGFLLACYRSRIYVEDADALAAALADLDAARAAADPEAEEEALAVLSTVTTYGASPKFAGVPGGAPQGG